MKRRVSCYALAGGLGLVAIATIDTAAIAGPRITRPIQRPYPTPKPAPAPTPSPAASPTPRLATGDYPGLRALIAVGEPTAYGGDGVSAATHPTTVHYDAPSQTYVLYDYDGGPGYGYSPNEIVTGQSNAAYTVYRDADTGSTLKLLNQSASNPIIALTYVTYGKWIVPQNSPIIFADNYMVFGQATPAASIPRTGSASYNAVLDGTYQSGSNSYHLSGDAKYTANFGNATMSVAATPIATHVSDGSQLVFGTLTGGGYIYFNGSPTGDNSTFSANTPYIGTTRFSSKGNFYGPQANEIGGVFTIKSNVGGSAGEGGGAFVGKQ